MFDWDYFFILPTSRLLKKGSRMARVTINQEIITFLELKIQLDIGSELHLSTALAVCLLTRHIFYYPGMSVKAGGGGILPPVGVWCAGSEDRMKVGIKSFQTKVKASKSDKRFQSYRHLKIGYILWVYQQCLRSTVPPVNADQSPVRKFPENPVTVHVACKYWYFLRYEL